MTDIETLAERLRTVERAVTDGTTEFPEVTELAELENRMDTVEGRLADIDERTAELEAATQALRGYVGNIRSVNEDVEQRADAALAATDRLEVRLDEELASPSVKEPAPRMADVLDRPEPPRPGPGRLRHRRRRLLCLAQAGPRRRLPAQV